MTLQDWQRQYLDALLRSQPQRAARYENVTFFTKVVEQPADGIQELLLHRTIAQLDSTESAIQLLDAIRGTGWKRYEPRILARIGNTEALLAKRPELSDYLHVLRKRSGYTTSSITDWCIIGDDTDLSTSDAPVWSSLITRLHDVVDSDGSRTLGLAELTTLLQHFYAAGIRIFQIALFSGLSGEAVWAETLHRVLTAPLIELAVDPFVADTFVAKAPSQVWSPHWKLRVASRASGWQIVEQHTDYGLEGLGATDIYTQISALLALSGLLRDGIHLTPIDDELVQPLKPSHPLWGFRRGEFGVANTNFESHDVRALALGFLEMLPAARRVSMFRSRLAMHLLSRAWVYRKSASIVTSEGGFYQQLVRIAKLFGTNQFEEMLAYVERSTFRNEPAFRYFTCEAREAISLITRLRQHSLRAVEAQVDKPDEILCVAHASVPDQSGGYAIRAHGILRSLQDAGVKISAVTRPGFPSGALTKDTTVVVDGVEYRRLPATSVTRSHGEIQYMSSFIEPFKKLFQERGVGIVHVRSTFLIALPALIAARELGLKVLYEVSGLWELVYQDREQESHLLKRSAFAELAETITMTNADQLIVMNEAVRQIALERGVKADRIDIAPNAVNVDDFVPLAPPEQEVFTLGYLGSFQDYEGLEDLVDAVSILKSQGHSLRVLMVGDGLQLSSIRSRIRAANVDDIFELTGRVPHDQVISYYAQMHVLVYPRRSTGATESITPLKPFEALALAKPIIVSDVQPLSEVVGNNERGLSFESGNVDDLANTIYQVMNDNALRARLGETGRRWVVQHRNWETVVNSFVSAYGNLHTSRL